MRSLATAVEELSPHEVSEHRAIRYILGHLNFLCGQGLGPSTEVHEDYLAWTGNPSNLGGLE